jgi:hypothetical protein
VEIEKTRECRLINRQELELVAAAVRRGESVLVIAEAGTGTDVFAAALAEELSGEFDTATAVYKGSGKNFFAKLAEQLDIPTEEPKFNAKGEEVGTKPLSMDGLKEQIAMNLSAGTLLIFPEAKRLTTGIRYWLEDLMGAGVSVVCFAAANPRRDIFLDMVEIELSLPSEQHIRQIMRDESSRYGLNLSESELAELQPMAGRNPMVARQVVKRKALGIEDEVVSHTQYINVTPLWFAFLAGFAAMKFVGMGMGDKTIQVFGGLAFMAFMSLKQLGRIQGAKKKLGQ